MNSNELIARLSDVDSHGLREIDADIFDTFPDERWPRCAYREENCVTLRYGAC